ncbi:lipase [Acrasis kona]|uniref:Lipase n=1 Tax=Acrasis kona TaxID=1008807 RepID=A0AAW2ZH29_9EUKA
MTDHHKLTHEHIRTAEEKIPAGCSIRTTFDAEESGIYRLNAEINGWFSSGAEVSISFNGNKERIDITLNAISARLHQVDLFIQYKTSIELTTTADYETYIGFSLFRIYQREVKSLDDVLNRTTLDQHQAETKQKHLLIFCHGNHRTAEDMFEMGETCRSFFDNCSFFKNENHQLYVLYSRSNQNYLTHDGIQTCSQRLFQEIINFASTFFLPTDKVLFSVVGHSLGGLIARHCIASIFEDPLMSQILVPVGLLTISTPHLGARKPSGLTVGDTVLKHGADAYMYYLLGQTGKELSLYDDIENPLLLKMSEPDSSFVKALNRFRTRTVTGATHYDYIVPHASALITSSTSSPVPDVGTEKFSVSEFSGFGDEGHDHSLLFTDVKQVVFQDPIHEGKYEKSDYISDSLGQNETMYHILYNLQQVTWRRISLQFALEFSSQHIAVHDMAINKTKWFKEIIAPRTLKASSSCVNLLSKVMLIDHHSACVDLRRKV